MVKSLEEMLVERPVNRAAVDEHKARMLDEVRAYRLRELREKANLTQSELAARIGVGQRQISKIENGDLENAKIKTLRKYLEAVGGSMVIEYAEGDTHLQVA